MDIQYRPRRIIWEARFSEKKEISRRRGLEQGKGGFTEASVWVEYQQAMTKAA